MKSNPKLNKKNEQKYITKIKIKQNKKQIKKLIVTKLHANRNKLFLAICLTKKQHSNSNKNKVILNLHVQKNTHARCINFASPLN